MSLEIFNIAVKVIAPSFPANYCPTIQELANDLAIGFQFQLPGPYSGLIIRDTEPEPKDRDKLWLKLVSPTGPAERFYFYNGTYGWIWPHEVPPESRRRLMIEGTEAQIKTEDGGVDEAITLAAGPFWAIDHNYDRRSPMGPGENVDEDITLAVGGVEGEEFTALTPDQMKHFHGVGASVNNPVPDAPQWISRNWAVDEPITTWAQDWTDGPANFNATTTFGDRGTTDPLPIAGDPADSHNTIHPVRGIYFCQRTTRKYYKAT